MVSENPEELARGQRTAFDFHPSREEVLEQLERIVHSVHFCNSKRYPALLRFVVEQTLEEHSKHLKERTLGVEVFGRRPDYDTNADPIVRFTAGEIRKRLAQYYQMSEHGSELRFELPLGSYVPAFVAPASQAALPAVASPLPLQLTSQEACTITEPVLTANKAEGSPPTRERPTAALRTPLVRSLALRLRHYRQAAAVLLLVLLMVAVFAGWSAFRHRGQEPGSSALWQPLLSSRGQCMIVLGVHSLDFEGKDLSPLSFAGQPDKQQSMLASMLRSQMVPISDVMSYGRLTELLVRNHHTCVTRSASATTFNELRAQPIVLIGGFDNIWTMRLTQNLRFHFSTGSQLVNEIVDAQDTHKHWTFDSAQNALSNSEDYGIVSEFFDPQIEQHVIVIAGIGKDGTEAAAEFATNTKDLTGLLSKRSKMRSTNFEVVLSTQIIEGRHGPPHIVVSYAW